MEDQELISRLVAASEHWSASDVVALCKEAAMARLRVVLNDLESGKVSEEAVDLRIGVPEVDEALRVVRPSYSLELQKRYEKWADEFGS